MKTLGTVLSIGAITLASLTGCNKTLETYKGKYDHDRLHATLQQKKDSSERFIKIVSKVPGTMGWVTAYDANGNKYFDSSEIDKGVLSSEYLLKYANSDSLNKIAQIALGASQ
jgi:hypothetical protein